MADSPPDATNESDEEEGDRKQTDTHGIEDSVNIEMEKYKINHFDLKTFLREGG